ncbi:MAG: glycosyltransferase family A protein [Bacteroidota bacterium]
MQKTPLVTVICLCYNHEVFVVDSLNSVINQNYKNIELIIVDDYSPDNSKKVIEKWLEEYPNIQFISNDVNIGNTKSFNNALKMANGEYIIDLAADDILMPDCIALQIESFEKSTYKNLGVVYGNAELITEESKFNSYYFAVDTFKKVIQKRITGDIYLSVISGGDSICSVSAMIKKSVFDKLIGFDETLLYEDLDFWIRASRIYEFDFIDSILVKKRKVSNSLGSQFYQKFKAKSKKINYSTFLIINKAKALNKTREENKALLKRVHSEMTNAYKTYNFILFIKYIPLELKLRFS